MDEEMGKEDVAGVSAFKRPEIVKT